MNKLVCILCAKQICDLSSSFGIIHQKACRSYGGVRCVRPVYILGTGKGVVLVRVWFLVFDNQNINCVDGTSVFLSFRV
jgi:hypothetical protein